MPDALSALLSLATAAPAVPSVAGADAAAAHAAVTQALAGATMSTQDTIRHLLVQVSYVSAGALFILALKWLSAPDTARQGVWAGEIGMFLAVVGTLLRHEVVSYEWIFAGFFLGAAVGVPMAVLMPMTAVPQRTALSHAFGALATALVGVAHFYLQYEELRHSPLTVAILCLEVLLGGLTFTGSLMAFGKLQELIPGKPLTYPGQIFVNLGTLGAAIVLGGVLTYDPTQTWAFPLILVLSLAFGVMLIIPIGGADMPTVISLLNSYAGLSASMMGFVLNNNLLIVAGALDGSSGFILSVIMCKAMNRSFTNVLFGAFGQGAPSSAAAGEKKPVRASTPDDAALLLGDSSLVVVVPGYGMAVAQAQHKVRELYDQLTKRGVEVKFAIHPVAGRMPGHMNVLLAEAELPYDKMVEMEEINPEFAQADAVLVIGANDVTNPAARHDKGSPIYGMPILEVDKAKTVFVIKRGMSTGFAGIENELYHLDKTQMLFGDAKAVVADLVKALSGGGGH
jgi:NAD(P) transhydrogenase subunit beta